MARKIILGFLIAIPIIGALIALDNHVIKNNDLLYKLFHEYEIHYWILVGIAYFVFIKYQKKKHKLSRNFIFDAKKTPQLLLEMIGAQKNSSIKTKTKNTLKDIKKIIDIFPSRKGYLLQVLTLNNTEKHILIETEEELGILKIQNAESFTLKEILAEDEKNKKALNQTKQKTIYIPKKVFYLTLGLFAIIIIAKLNINQHVKIVTLIILSSFFLREFYKEGIKWTKTFKELPQTKQDIYAYIKRQIKDSQSKPTKGLTKKQYIILIIAWGILGIAANYLDN